MAIAIPPAALLLSGSLAALGCSPSRLIAFSPACPSAGLLARLLSFLISLPMRPSLVWPALRSRGGLDAPEQAESLRVSRFRKTEKTPVFQFYIEIGRQLLLPRAGRYTLTLKI